jgi:hypothetical protein
MKTLLSRTALALVCAMTALGTAQADGYPHKGRAIDQIRPASDYAQIAQSRPLALGIMRARAQGFVPSPQLQAYVNGVLLKVVSGIALPAGLQPEVRVLAAPEFVALCTPDGTIVITIGLLEQLDNEDELAFILGHEVSHALYRHHKGDWYNKSEHFAVLSDTTLSTTLRGATISIGGFSTQNLAQAADVLEHVQKLSRHVFAPQMARDQEDAADALGFDLMVKAGYDPEAALGVMDKLAVQEEQAAAEAQAEKAEAKKDSGGGTGSTIASIGGSLGGFLTGGGLSGGASTMTLVSTMITVFDGAVDSLADESTAHHPASEREELLSNYAFREYRTLVFSNPTPLPWSAGSKAPEGPAIGALLSHYADAEDGAAFIADVRDGHGGSAPPQASVSRAVLAPTNDHAYTEYVAAEYYDYRGQPAQSEAALVRAVNGPEPSWEIYSRLLDLYIARQDWTKANLLMAQAVTRFDNSPILLPKRITILRGSGQTGEVPALVSQCKKYGFDELTAQCKSAASA